MTKANLIKYIRKDIAILSIGLLISVCGNSQKIIDSGFYETAGHLITVGENGGYWVKPIIMVEYYRTIATPCSTKYKWNGENGYGSISDNPYDSTKDYGPCGYMGIFSGFNSEYKGDTIFVNNCTKWETDYYKTEYFVPSKLTKDKKKRELYIKKPNEYFGRKDKWSWEWLSTIFICG
jgi:hypothetical protein